MCPPMSGMAFPAWILHCGTSSRPHAACPSLPFALLRGRPHPLTASKLGQSPEHVALQSATQHDLETLWKYDPKITQNEHLPYDMKVRWIPFSFCPFVHSEVSSYPRCASGPGLSSNNTGWSQACPRPLVTPRLARVGGEGRQATR